MSRIRADRYTNRLGTGAPTFSNGVNIIENVGIGTTNPADKLHVVAGNGNGILVSAPVTPEISLKRNGAAAATGNIDWLGSTNVIGARIGVNDDIAGSMQFKLGGTGAQSDTKMIIESGGDVGIGTDSVNRKCVISQSNTTAYSPTDFDQNYQVLKIQNTQDNQTAGMQFLIGANGEAAITATETSDGATDLAFGTRGSGVRGERLRITHTGHVGIATDATGQNALLSMVSDGTSAKKPATLYQNQVTGTGAGKGFYVGTNHNDKVGYVWNYEADALSFATNNVQRARIDSDGYMTVAPSGMVIRSGFYDTGTGTGAKTNTTSSSYTTLNINGTGQVGHNIGKASDDVVTYNKVSSNSHLNISVSFPYYLASATDSGFGIRGMLSTNDGSNYYAMSGLNDGPAHGWGAGGYGGNQSGVFNFTWNTRMNSTQASTILAKTGTIRFYFEVKVWNSSDTITMIDYSGSYPKKGSIVVQEIAE